MTNISRPKFIVFIAALFLNVLLASTLWGQRVSNTPAAVFVITRDDIRRSGATSIPEALRLAPGVEVARINKTKWAVSVRGLNGRFADKLLVLLDNLK